MFGTHDLTLFVLSCLLLNVTPGPDTAYIVARSTQLGRTAGVMAALGIGVGCLVHITAAALGVSAVLAASATAFTFIKLAGAAYLVYLGVRLLFSRGSGARVSSGPAPSADLAAVFRQGFVTNVLNPKVALFFLAFLPQFIDLGTPSKPVAFAFLGLIFNTTGTLWNILVAVVAARAAARVRQAGWFRTWIDRVVGAAFIGLGVRLAVLAKP